MKSWIETYVKGMVTDEDIKQFFLPNKEGRLGNFRKMIAGED